MTRHRLFLPPHLRPVDDKKIERTNTHQTKKKTKKRKTKLTMTSKVLDLERNLSSQTLALMKSAQVWGEQELEPLIAKHWEEGTLPPNILENFRFHCPQLLGYTLPKPYGGQGYDLITSCHISKTIAMIDASFVTALLVQYGLCAESILLCGTESQRNRFLPILAQLEQIGCFCLTEPQSGSDASQVTTMATKVPGGYHITGSKRWIGNADVSEIFVVWAQNTSLPGNPVMGFIVQRSQQQSNNNNTPTPIETTKIEGKISLRMTQNANVEFRNAFCPDCNVMHEHGKCRQQVLYICVFVCGRRVCVCVCEDKISNHNSWKHIRKKFFTSLKLFLRIHPPSPLVSFAVNGLAWDRL